MKITQLENGFSEHDLGFAIVRLPLEGPTEKELKVIENAAKDFYKAIIKQGKSHLISSPTTPSDQS